MWDRGQRIMRMLQIPQRILDAIGGRADDLPPVKNQGVRGGPANGAAHLLQSVFPQCMYAKVAPGQIPRRSNSSGDPCLARVIATGRGLSTAGSATAAPPEDQVDRLRPAADRARKAHEVLLKRTKRQKHVS